MTRVALEKLTKRYGSATAVNGIDLNIDDGEFIVLLGPSGCGKTTTLRCIAGLEGVSDGAIRFDGKVVSSPGVSLPPEHRHIGMVFQSYAVWPHMTVAENVAFGLKLKRLPRAEIDTRVAKALDTVGLARLQSVASISSRVASSSAWRLPAPSCWSRASSSSTNP